MHNSSSSNNAIYLALLAGWGTHETREFIGLPAAWPMAARGQQTNPTRRIGVLFGLAEGDPR
jgi:hypothetical protein